MFLVDNQLPIALARWLSSAGYNASHVVYIGFESCSDKAIWAYAQKHNLTIISKDDDFRILSDQQGSVPPQVIWVRLGNCRKEKLLQVFSSLLPELVSMIEQQERLIELYADE